MKTKIPLSERAIVARINRKLIKEGYLRLKKARGGRAVASVGDYYLIDANRNLIHATHVNPEGYARQIDVMSKYEAMAD